MLFQLNITLTEEDYFAFNYFHSFESQQGKKRVMRARIAILAISALLMLFFLLRTKNAIFTAIFAMLWGLYMIPYLLTFKKRLRKNLSAQIKRMKKTGKLPYSPSAAFEFYDDKMVEITATTRTEQIYDAFERICVVGDRWVLMYNSSVNAYILPISQISAQVDEKAFLQFLFGKCSTVEHY